MLLLILYFFNLLNVKYIGDINILFNDIENKYRQTEFEIKNNFS